MCDHDMRANTIISKYKYPFMSRERKYFSYDTDLCTSMYVLHCLGYFFYQMMKSAMGYTSTDNYTKPSYFRTNSVCQHNQNSKMCWHDPEHMTETYYRSQCTTPAKNKTKELLYAVQYCQKPLWLTLAKKAEFECYFLD